MDSNTAQPPAMAGHRFSSVAVDRCRQPDFIDLHAIPLPEGLPLDPAWWARHAFSGPVMPRWVRALMRVRQPAIRLLGVKPLATGRFAIDEVVGEEALIEVFDRHLDFWCAVGVDVENRLLRATTVVTLHGWRGRAYWAVVQPFHGPVVTAMMQRAVRVASASGGHGDGGGVLAGPAT